MPAVSVIGMVTAFGSDLDSVASTSSEAPSLTGFGEADRETWGRPAAPARNTVTV